AAAFAASRVAAEGAVAHRQRCAARCTDTVVEDAAAGGGRQVVAQGAGDHRQRRAAVETVVEDASAEADRRVAADGAVAHRERRVVVVDAAAAVGCADGKPVADGQAGDRDGDGVGDKKHAAGGVAVHGHIAGPGAGNGAAVIYYQFAAGQ